MYKGRAAMWRVASATCAAFVTATAVTSLPPGRVAAEHGQQPTFRAATQLIEIDVRVTDRDGRFITGLSRDDFIVLEDGKPQKITQLSFVNLSTSDQQIGEPEAGAS